MVDEDIVGSQVIARGIDHLGRVATPSGPVDQRDIEKAEDSPRQKVGSSVLNIRWIDAYRLDLIERKTPVQASNEFRTRCHGLAERFLRED